MRLSDPEAWHFDIDRWLNPLMPRPPWRILPYPISYFLGHRKQPLKPIGNLIMVAWAFLGIFVGLIVVEIVTKQVPIFQDHHAPIIIASFVGFTQDLPHKCIILTAILGRRVCPAFLFHRITTGTTTKCCHRPAYCQYSRCWHLQTLCLEPTL